MALSAEEVELTSPNGLLMLHVNFKNGRAFYHLMKQKDTIIQQSSLDVFWKNKPHDLPSMSIGQIDSCAEKWNSIWGQHQQVENNYKTIQISEKWSNGTVLTWCFRLYDHGLAFRYKLLSRHKNDSLIIANEESQINLKEDGSCWWAWADYDTQEQQFHHTKLLEATWVNTPFTVRYNNGIHLSIHEAGLKHYSRMTLKRNKENIWTTDLVPWPNGDLVRGVGNIQSPWRAIIVEETASGLITSELIRNLNDPCAISNTQWIKPISYIGIWWEMHLGEKTWTEGVRHGATTQRAKQAINFAATHQVGGVLIEGWNTGWSRWGQDSVFDQTTPASDYNLKEIAQYAKMKGIELIMHCETGGDAMYFESRIDSAFRLYKKLGINYVKTGYAGAARPAGAHLYGQEMVEHYQKIVEKAAQYQLMLDVHECVQPTGLERTWPNLMTGEGVRGQEWEAWSEGHDASHTALLPFTRGLAGPMDYNPGIYDVDFSNRKEYIKWNGQETNLSHPRVHTTSIHQMALTIVLYSPFQMAADKIENYETSQEWKWFLSVFNPDYVDTKVLYAEVGGPVVIARKQRNGVWVVGAVNNEKLNEIEFSWGELAIENDVNAYTIQAEKFDEEKLMIQGVNTQNSPTERILLQPGGGKIWVFVPRPSKLLYDD